MPDTGFGFGLRRELEAGKGASPFFFFFLRERKDLEGRMIFGILANTILENIAHLLPAKTSPSSFPLYHILLFFFLFHFSSAFFLILLLPIDAVFDSEFACVCVCPCASQPPYCPRPRPRSCSRYSFSLLFVFVFYRCCTAVVIAVIVIVY